MKICVIGAGITGLTIARLLRANHDITVFEKESTIGGIAKTKSIGGVSYHTVGGHCFNSKHKEVMDFVFNEVLPIDEWHRVKREAKINFDNNIIPYPIEYSIKEIANTNMDMALKITQDFLSSLNTNKVENLEEWFIQKFGTTLAEQYFIPYNRKIWQMEPSEMSHLWVEGKLPLPNKEGFFKALIGDSKDEMPHSEFYYPNSNNQNTFIEAMAEGTEITNNFTVNSIEFKNKKWIINSEFKFDKIISTIPLKILPHLLQNTPKEVLNHTKNLKYNKVTNMLWKTKKTDATWTYYPSKGTIFHRHIHIGNFFLPTENYTITESMGEHSYEEMLKYGQKIDYLIEPLDYNVSDYAYVVYDKNYKQSTEAIKKYIDSLGLYSIGRFGEWEYYNMDICIKSAMNLKNIVDG